MKITIESEDPKEAKRMVKSLDLCLAIFDIKAKIRFLRKNHGETFDNLETAIYDILEEYNIDTDDLID